jgi:hypothetical protein
MLILLKIRVRIHSKKRAQFVSVRIENQATRHQMIRAQNAVADRAPQDRALILQTPHCGHTMDAVTRDGLGELYCPIPSNESLNDKAFLAFGIDQ